MEMKWMTDDEVWIYDYGYRCFCVNFATSSCAFTDSDGSYTEMLPFIETTKNDVQYPLTASGNGVFISSGSTKWPLYIQAKNEWTLKQLEEVLLVSEYL